MPADAQSISITNAGFESDVLNCTAGPQCFAIDVIPGWTLIGEVATFKPSTGPGAEFPGGIPEGSNVAAVGKQSSAGVITEDLGFAPLANTTYTLTVSVGQRADFPLTAYAVELLVGTTSVGSDTTLRPAAGTFALDRVTYNSGSSPGTGHLFIRLSGSGGGQADFDRVALNAASSVPPSITSGGIVPVYSSSPVIQPGSWVSIYGNNFAGATIAWNSIGSGDFGSNWHVTVPYQVRPEGEINVPFLNVRVAQKMWVKNLITGREEVLSFNRTKECYLPADPEASALLAVVWMTDGTVRLIDKLGNEYQFDNAGWLTHFLISDDFSIEYSYARERADERAFEKPPYRLSVDGQELEKIGPVLMPARLILVDERAGAKETFNVDKNPNREIAGYVPKDGAQSHYEFLALLTDRSFLLEDRKGNQIAFDRDGRFDYISPRVIRSLRQGDYSIEFDYEFHQGQFRIRQARVMQKGLSASLYSLRYDYANDGRLARITGPDGVVREVYPGNGKVVATVR